TAVGTNVPVVLGFTRPVARATVPGAVSLTSAAGVVAGTFSYTGDYKQVTFTPSAPLAANTLHTLSYTAAIEDSVGTPL
ncbi:Ig-like domain-containing protein, partial [Enterococcus casseliflavus]|uniref:Ig-like domain-containing protein n=1 Tax=Enterococcus casseliflavus TaxID=37734 RepID=UPI003D09BAAF